MSGFIKKFYERGALIPVDAIIELRNQLSGSGSATLRSRPKLWSLDYLSFSIPANRHLSCKFEALKARDGQKWRNGGEGRTKPLTYLVPVNSTSIAINCQEVLHPRYCF